MPPKSEESVYHVKNSAPNGSSRFALRTGGSQSDTKAGGALSVGCLLVGVFRPPQKVVHTRLRKDRGEWERALCIKTDLDYSVSTSDVAAEEVACASTHSRAR